MTEEQIIEYLKHCSTTESCHKDKCPCLKDGHTCIAFESKPVLDLINRQKAEIKNHNVEVNKMVAEIEKLEEQVNLWQEEAGSVGCANEWLKAYFKNAKAEAIKELLDKIEKQAIPNEDDVYWVELDDIYNSVKEMVGEG